MKSYSKGRFKRQAAAVVGCAALAATALPTAQANATETVPELVSATVRLDAPYDTEACVYQGRDTNKGCGYISGRYTLSGVPPLPPPDENLTRTYYNSLFRMTVKRQYGCQKNGRLVGRTLDVEMSTGWIGSPRTSFRPEADGTMEVQFFDSDAFERRGASPLKCPSGAIPVLTRLQVDDIWARVDSWPDGLTLEFQLPNPHVWVGVVRTPSVYEPNKAQT
jgi:hypothetical protein